MVLKKRVNNHGNIKMEMFEGIIVDGELAYKKHKWTLTGRSSYNITDGQDRTKKGNKKQIILQVWGGENTKIIKEKRTVTDEPYYPRVQIYFNVDDFKEFVEILRERGELD